MPIEFEHKTLQTALELNITLPIAQQDCILHLNELDEWHKSALHNTELIQSQRKQWHDKFIKDREFSVGDWVLLYDSCYQHHQGKFQTRWLGLYEIVAIFNNGAFQLSTIDPVKFKLLVNGHCLKLYQKPTTQEKFLQQFNTLETSLLATTPTESSTQMPIAH